MSLPPRPLPAALLAGLLLLAPAARSQPGGRALQAEALYKEGKSLVEQERYGEACPKLAESQRLDPGGGTLLLLALCHEKEGKLASAWIEFKEAAQVARRDKRDDRAKLARQHIESIEPRVPTLRFEVDAAALSASGAALSLDGTPLSPAALSVPLPVDPGERVVELNAPGKLPWRSTVRLSAGEKQAIKVPSPADLEPAPAAAASASAPASSSASTPPPPPSSPPPPPGRSLGVGSVTAGVLGLVGLGLGAYWGLDARSLAREANDACPAHRCAIPSAVDRSKQADRSATLSNVAFALGGVALATGAALYLFWPPASPGSPSVGVAVGPDAARISIRGSF